MAGEDIERLRQAALKDPAQMVRLADALVASDRADEAVHACRNGLQKRPDDVPLRLALGRALSAAGHLEEAQAARLEAVARQQKQRAGAGPARGPAPPPQPTPLSRLQPMDDTAPSLPSFGEGESTEDRATTMRPSRKATQPYAGAPPPQQQQPTPRYEEYQPRRPGPPKRPPPHAARDGGDLRRRAHTLF